MKKIISIALIAAIALFSLCSCLEEIAVYDIKLVYGNGEKNGKLRVRAGEEIEVPEDPVRENYIFCGWYSDAAMTERCDLLTDISSDMILYAKWIPDLEYVNNRFMKVYAKANVMVHSSHLYRDMSVDSSLGSGVIIAHTSDSYYVLTNNHVVHSEGNPMKTEIAVMDAYGEMYEAYIVCSDSDYDLAIVRFKSKTQLSKIEISEGTPERNEPIIAVGHPGGQINVITYGDVVDMEETNIENGGKTSTVTFPVIWHTADIAEGSSGGALLNLDLELIGLNFAAATTEGGEFAYGYAIPADKILEFINENFGSYQN